MHDGAVGVKLGGRMARVVGEFLDEVLVAIAQLILWKIGDGKLVGAEVLNEIAQHRIREAILVGPLGVAEDAIKLFGVCGLYRSHGGLESLANVVGGRADLAPV